MRVKRKMMVSIKKNIGRKNEGRNKNKDKEKNEG